jgi:Holliday junction resolvase RusA-like endonuclease
VTTEDESPLREFSGWIAVDPKGKASVRFGGGGGAFIDPKSRAYADELRRQLRRQIRVNAFDGPVGIDLEFVFAIPKSRLKNTKPGDFHTQKPDVDNLVKGFCDAVTTCYRDWYEDVVASSFAAQRVCWKVKGNRSVAIASADPYPRPWRDDSDIVYLRATKRWGTAPGIRWRIFSADSTCQT